MPILGLVNRQTTTFERVGGRRRHVAVVKIGIPTVGDNGADVRGMPSLDPKAAHPLALQLDVDVVFLGTSRRRAGVDYLDGRLGLRRSRNACPQRGYDEDSEDCLSGVAHRRHRSSPNGAGS